MNVSAVFAERQDGKVECIACSLTASDALKAFDDLRHNPDPQYRKAMLVIRPMPWREAKLSQTVVATSPPRRGKKQ